MIAKLRGVVDSIENDQIILDVSGVGYAVNVTKSTIGAFPVEGAEATLHIHAKTSDEGTTLFGFSTKEELELFRILLAVPGVGGKVALAIISTLGIEELKQALLQGNLTTICKTPGVGKKLATRLVGDLAGKITNLPVSTFYNEKSVTGFSDDISADSLTPVAIRDTISALINLGYNRNVSVQLTTSAANQVRDSIDLADISSAEKLIKLALSSARKS